MTVGISLQRSTIKDSTVTIWSYARRYDPRLELNIMSLASQLPDIQPVSQGVSLDSLNITYPNTHIYSSYGSSYKTTTVSPPSHRIPSSLLYSPTWQADIKRIVFGGSRSQPLYGKLNYGENYFTVKNPARDTDREYTKGSDEIKIIKSFFI